MQKPEPLFGEGENAFKRRFNDEVKDEQNEINLRDSFGQSSTHSDNRHEEKINYRRQ